MNLTTYEDSSKRPYIHLLDSGIADNIGLRALKLAFVTRDVPWSIVGPSRSWIDPATRRDHRGLKASKELETRSTCSPTPTDYVDHEFGK